MVSGILLLGAMAVASSIVRLVVYVDALRLLTGGADVDEKRKQLWDCDCTRG